MQKQLIGSVVGGAVMFIVGYVIFGVIWPMIFGPGPDNAATTATMVTCAVVGMVALFVAAQAMSTIGGGATRQVTKLFWFAAGVLIYARIGDAIWTPTGNPMDEAVGMLIGELIALTTGGYVMSRWFLSSEKAA